MNDKDLNFFKYLGILLMFCAGVILIGVLVVKLNDPCYSEKALLSKQYISDDLANYGSLIFEIVDSNGEDKKLLFRGENRTRYDLSEGGNIKITWCYSAAQNKYFTYNIIKWD